MDQEMSNHQEKLKANIRLLVEGGKLEEAKGLLDQYEKAVANDIESYSIRGVIAIIEGDMEEAERVLREGLELNSRSFSLLYNLAYIHQVKGDEKTAIANYKKAMQNADNEEDRDMVYELLQELGVRESKEDIISTKEAPAITILTRVYNAKSYIHECADSVLNQSFKDFEWVVLDNGCTDGTSEILQTYAKKDKRIKLFKNKKNSMIYNRPHTVSYNKYIENLRTEYIVYLDSDDYLHKDFLKELYTLAKKYDADIVAAGTEMFSDENPQISGKRCPPNFHADDISELGDIFPQIYGTFRPLWGKMIRTPISLKSWKYFLKYNSNMLNGGDTMSCLYFLRFSSSVVLLDKVLHYYRVRATSHYNSQFNKDRYQDYLKIYNESITLLKDWGKINDENKDFITAVLYYSLRDCIHIFAKTKNVPIVDRIEAINLILSDNKVREAINKGDLLLSLFDEAIEATNFIIDKHRK